MTEEEIKAQAKRKGEDLLQMQLTVDEGELRAADEVADEENKSVVKSIIDPTPGLVVDDEIDFKDINFLAETTDNKYKLPPKVQKQLDEMVLDTVQSKTEEDIYIDDELNSYMFQDDEEMKAEIEEDKIKMEVPEDYANIAKPLDATVIEISSDEEGEDEPMYITTTPSHLRDRLRRIRKSVVAALVLENDDVEFVKVNTFHPRDRPRRSVGDVKFIGLTSSHPRNRLRRRVKKEDVKFLKKVPSHHRYRLRRMVDQVATVTNVRPIHPRDRMKPILRNTLANISLDADFLKDLPYFNAKIKVDELNKKKRREAIMDKIIKQLPPNNDIYYVDHGRKTDTFRVRKDSKIKIESDDDEIEFIRQTLSHPRDRLTCKSRQQVRPRERLASEVRRSKRLAKKQRGEKAPVIVPTGALLAAGKIKIKHRNKRERTKKLLTHQKRLENVPKKLQDPDRVKKLDHWIRDNIKRELANG